MQHRPTDERLEDSGGECMCFSALASWLRGILGGPYQNPSRPNSYVRGSYQAPQVVTPGVSFSRSVCGVGNTPPEDERGRLLPENVKMSNSSRELDGVESGTVVAAREGAKSASGAGEGGMARVASSKSLKKMKRSLGSGVSLSEEDDFCPTCLEAYTVENPKIMTKCQHHFHLSCIYEWLERANTCPVCFRAMSFDELT
ncbi:hypothetical protein BSKO_07446 [Bryopsis sp. KO-2023]|nr:hypothetical protein BSKO_07446 [Bryopsis sp. KO-2023]